MKRIVVCAMLLFGAWAGASDEFSVSDQASEVLVKCGGAVFHIEKNPSPEWGKNAVLRMGDLSDGNALSFIMTSLEGVDKDKPGPVQLLTGKSSSVKILRDDDDFKIVSAEYGLYPCGKPSTPHPKGKFVLISSFQKGIPAALVLARPSATGSDFTLSAFAGCLGRDFDSFRLPDGKSEAFEPGTWKPFPKTELILLGKNDNTYMAVAHGGKTRTPSRGLAVASSISQYTHARLHEGEHGEMKMLVGVAGGQESIDAAMTYFRTFSYDAPEREMLGVTPENVIVPEKKRRPPAIDGKLSEWTSKPIERGAGHDRPRDSITWKGENDLSLKVWTSFDKDNLYIACRVNDDCFNQKNTNGSIWAGDMLQISFDPLLEKSVTDNFMDIGLTASDTPTAWCWQHPDKKYVGDISKVVEFRTSRDAKGANYEVAIPWTFLKPFDLRRSKLGFSLAALDADEGPVENWIGLTEGVAGGKAPEVYCELHLGSNEEIIASTCGYSSPMLFFNSEFLLADEPNTFSASVLMKKEEIPAELVVEIASGEKTREFRRELKPGFNSFNLAIVAGELPAGEYKTSVCLFRNGSKSNEKTSRVSLIDSACILKQVEEARTRYEKLAAMTEKIQAAHGSAPYLASALGIAEYFIPFVQSEVTRQSIFREKQLRSGAGREDVPLDGQYKLFVYPRAQRNIAYVNKMLENSLAQAGRILGGKEKPLSVPELKKGVRPSIEKGSFLIDGKPALFLGPNTWSLHYTQIPGIARCGFNFMDVSFSGNNIKRKDEPFSIPKGYSSPNGNLLVEMEKNGVCFFARQWEGNTHLDETSLAALEKKLESGNKANAQLDSNPNLLYFVTQSETFTREKDLASEEESFQTHLRKKFDTLEKLNTTLGSSFQDFKEIKNQAVASNVALKYEFFLWRRDHEMDMLGKFTAAKRKCLKSPFSTHFSTLNFYAYDPLIGCADYEELWKNFEVIGWDGGIGPDDRHYAMRWSDDEILHCDLAKSFHPDKPIANNEAHNIPGKYGGEISSEFIRAALFQPYLHGRNAAVLWLWDLDGHSPWGNHIFTRANTHHAAATAALDLRRLADYVTAFQRITGPVAILYSLPSMADSSHVKNMTSVYEGIFFSGFPARFVSERQVAAGRLDGCRMLIVPDSRRVSEDTFKRVRDFAASGGRVILVGPESLSRDEHGKVVPSREEQKDKMSVIPLSTPENYFAKFCSALDELKLRPDVEVRDVNGKRIWGLEYRSAKMPDGSQLVYLLNMGKESKTAVVEGKGKLFDLTTDKWVESKIDLKPLDLYLLKVDR